MALSKDSWASWGRCPWERTTLAIPFPTSIDLARIEARYDILVSAHLGRAATVLLCLITELQAHCRFEGANINERIHNIWKTLLPLFEANELYEERYAKLMEERGISPL